MAYIVSSLTGIFKLRSVSFQCRNDPSHSSSDFEQFSNWVSKLNKLCSG